MAGIPANQPSAMPPKHPLLWLLLFFVLMVTPRSYLGAQTIQASSPTFGSVPSGPASREVLHLKLRDAINMALRYNLGEIESGENARIARGERLHALSALLPQVSAGASENVEQFSTATLGIRVPLIPSVVGPFSFSEAAVTLTQNLFSLPAIQRFRAARNAEQAARLNYQDTLDVITLIVGNAYLQVIETNSRIGAAEAQVRNAQALFTIRRSINFRPAPAPRLT